MNSTFGSRLAGGNTAYERVRSDFYPTPPDATNALLDFLDLPQNTRIWEPACGENHMVDVMRSRGYQVIGSDIQTGTDYLTAECVECDWIITNPPFSLADKFIQRSVEHGKPFAFLLKSQYWHSKKRLELFENYPPSFVCPLTWRPDFLFKQRGRGASVMEVIWCLWNPPHNQQTIYKPLRRGKR